MFCVGDKYEGINDLMGKVVEGGKKEVDEVRGYRFE